MCIFVSEVLVFFPRLRECCIFYVLFSYLSLNYPTVSRLNSAFKDASLFCASAPPIADSTHASTSLYHLKEGAENRHCVWFKRSQAVNTLKPFLFAYTLTLPHAGKRRAATYCSSVWNPVGRTLKRRVNNPRRTERRMSWNFNGCGCWTNNEDRPEEDVGI